MSHDDHTAPRRRRFALGLGTAAGASLAATFISMGTASADPDTDPFSDLGVPNGSMLDALLPANVAAQLDGTYDLINTPDNDPFADLYPFAVGSMGDPVDQFLNSFDVTPGVTAGAFLDPFADQLAGDEDFFADAFGPASAPMDAFLGTIGLGPADAFLDAGFGL